MLKTILIRELINELVILNRYKLYSDVCNALWKYNLLHVYHIIAVNLMMKCVTQFSPRKSRKWAAGYRTDATGLWQIVLVRGGRGAYRIIPLELSVAATEPYRVRKQVLPPITPCPTASNDTTSVFGVFKYFFYRSIQVHPKHIQGRIWWWLNITVSSFFSC